MSPFLVLAQAQDFEPVSSPIKTPVSKVEAFKFKKVVLRPKKQFFFSLDFKTMLTKH